MTVRTTQRSRSPRATRAAHRAVDAAAGPNAVLTENPRAATARGSPYSHQALQLFFFFQAATALAGLFSPPLRHDVR
ncbi:hypothetical protein SAMN04489716_4246 [Actinoplanes derwentensis]|uniref:Uncharacterized protein n=1 Tax=Actinoplanes derwentensis TaxID=113562 RepID=A0A1H2B1U4_9ACTN|nr:hypothetical protein Ade03nite_65380 [Actinoplanes derwentensis]SDT51756.1 hypothetical protein SAMN04489716_4246 [Actinoplanes derwentensis]